MDIQLMKQSKSYNLNIPNKVEQKIRLLCKEIWTTEWSGILFYTYEGSFENDDLILTCEDIYLMDVGSAAYTEFDMNPEVISYMTDNDLLDCQIGLIHSHNNMNTFFSGTDINTLKKEGFSKNHFLSLIVNNVGSYTAAITRNIKSIQIIEETIKYNTFDDIPKEDIKKYTVEEDLLEYYNLNIIFTEFINTTDIVSRIKALKQIKENNKISTFKPEVKPYTPSSYTIPKVKEQTLPFYSEDKKESKTFLDANNAEDVENYYGKVHYDKNTLKTVLYQLLTGSIVIDVNSTKLDINNWVNSMESIYNKRFPTMKEFTSWAESYIEYLTWNTSDFELEKMGFIDVETVAILSYDLIELLKKLKQNKYIVEFIRLLENNIL